MTSIEKKKISQELTKVSTKLEEMGNFNANDRDYFGFYNGYKLNYSPNKRFKRKNK